MTMTLLILQLLAYLLKIIASLALLGIGVWIILQRRTITFSVKIQKPHKRRK